jgi:5-methyltetrahydropteroyltriglutamate--homocysteine methyltransferase
MVIAANLGFPRIGYRRELKKVLEQYWQKKAKAEELEAVAKNIRKHNWQIQKDAGIEHIPSNDFSLYDHVLDTAITFGAIPKRYSWHEHGQKLDLDTYFHMARGCAFDNCVLHEGAGVSAMEMTKWFDTNYHYIVPELSADQTFKLRSTKAIDEFKEAKALGIQTRPVLLGPISFLLLSKVQENCCSPLDLLDKLLPVYLELLQLLKEAGCDWVQIDEPCLVLDAKENLENACTMAYEQIAKSGLKILLATYFGRLGHNLALAFKLPVDAVHIDLVAAPEQLDPALKLLPAKMKLSVGIVDGRNIWACDLERATGLLQSIKEKIGEDRLIISPSCSLLHAPVDLEQETKIEPELHSWLAFAKQKIEEIVTLTAVVNGKSQSVQSKLQANTLAIKSRKTSPRVHNKAVQDRIPQLGEDMYERINGYAKRSKLQREHLNLPLLPTTTIGSFPQTKEVRQTRADYRAGKINAGQYDEAMKAEIKRTIAIQEEIDLDVLVHGEPERNDMVEYFAENLGGYLVTEHGWVQSYGSRYVKPPIIYGDIVRPQPITVQWSEYAQSLTKRPVKGMLTGPVTMLQWSFVRDDQPLSSTCLQLAMVIRDEVSDLEKAGISVIQIDEPAIREGLPLHKEDWQTYLNWAVRCFRLASSSVQDRTQIHTHMCYSEFNDIIESIAALDADVVSIETARSRLELLDAFVKFKYPNEIGPGVYDIHSPRVPPESEMTDLIKKALSIFSANQLWINPDCGLKTRGWEETTAALRTMVSAAKEARAGLELVQLLT